MAHELKILLPVVAEIKTDSGTYQLEAGRFSERWHGDPLWNARFDVKLDGSRLASIFDSESYPGKLHVSVNGVRWMGSLPADMYDGAYHDFVCKDNDLIESFKATVHRCEGFHKLRGGWKPGWKIAFSNAKLDTCGVERHLYRKLDEAVADCRKRRIQAIDFQYDVRFVGGYVA